MSAVVAVCGALLALAAAVTVVRLVRGPTVLDRAVCLDVLLAIGLAAIALDAVARDRPAGLIVLVVLGLLGFVGSLAIARFVSGEADR